jgi:hypothetical protein
MMLGTSTGGEKTSYDEACDKKHYKISGELGHFVLMVNDELAALRDISPIASPDFVKEATGRRKVMELEVRNALHIIKCLGMPESDAQCAGEAAAIEAEKSALQTKYKEERAMFDSRNWISLPVTVEKLSPAPKKP